jgi:FkbM family methyltransferase
MLAGVLLSLGKLTPMKINARKVGESGSDQLINALGRDWLWPREDTECWPVIFEWSPDLEQVYAIMQRTGKSFRSVVQAGGNMGVWPWLLAQRFARVYTFEPDPRCFHYLVQNTWSAGNIVYSQASLGYDRFHQRVKNLKGEETNLGAQYTENALGDDALPQLRIDDLNLIFCDLIYLDIEGHEMHALQGAIETIGSQRPVIVVEDKGLSDKFGVAKGEIEKWLELDFGYSVAARVHRDVILVP